MQVLNQGSIWVAVVCDQDAPEPERVVGVGTRDACMRRIEREWRSFADRESRKALGVPPPVWGRDSFTGQYEKNMWFYTEDHDSGICYGYVKRVRRLT